MWELSSQIHPTPRMFPKHYSLSGSSQSDHELLQAPDLAGVSGSTRASKSIWKHMIRQELCYRKQGGRVQDPRFQSGSVWDPAGSCFQNTPNRISCSGGRSDYRKPHHARILVGYTCFITPVHYHTLPAVRRKLTISRWANAQKHSFVVCYHLVEKLFSGRCSSSTPL